VLRGGHFHLIKYNTQKIQEQLVGNIILNDGPMFLCHIRSYLVLILLTSLVVLTILRITPKVTKLDDSKTKRFRKKDKNEMNVAKIPLYNVIQWKSASELGLESKTWRMRQVSAFIREPIPFMRPLHLSISRCHWIYSRRGWDAAPIVIPKYRLISSLHPRSHALLSNNYFFA
jgi:hypothetical protein